MLGQLVSKIPPAFSLPDSLTLPFDRSAIPFMQISTLGGGETLMMQSPRRPTLSTRARVTTQAAPSDVSQAHSYMAAHIISHTLHMREMRSSTLHGLPRITAIDDLGLQSHSSKALALPEFLIVYPHNRRLSVTHGDAKRPIKAEKLMQFLHFREESVSFRSSSAMAIAHPA